MQLGFVHEIRSLGEYQRYVVTHQAEFAAQRAYERILFSDRPEFTVTAHCVGCDKKVPMQVDLQWGNGRTPSWRERLECPCGLNNRIRASLHLLGQIIPHKPEAAIYATEQVTELYRQLKQRYPHTIGSEFLRDNTPPGAYNTAGLRHEDVTALTFANESFDAVLSFDVLEHVPDFKTAFFEIARVLRPGGTLLASFPFDTKKAKTEIRATIDAQGTITHHLPPEYHGDPVDQSGCLCFQVFGWSVLDDLRAAGFSDARALFYWSADYGYLGQTQVQILATRPNPPAR